MNLPQRHRDTERSLVLYRFRTVSSDSIGLPCPSSEIPGSIDFSPCLCASVVNFLLHVVRPLEFHRQFPRIEILANVSQSLLQLQQGLPNVFLVSEGDVAPHGIRTG